jgi:hypothetical protein
MAEYVRRKRPPANHPYWTRLHDRAHPPAVAMHVAVPGVIGVCLGLYGGLMEPMPLAKAVKTAAIVAAAGAGVTFATSIPVLVFDASRHMTGRERWPGALLAGLFVAVVLFVILLLLITPLLVWYAVCSGLGPWLGMLTGLAVGAVPGGILAWEAHRRWRQRQKQWPRWERMRAPRGARALTVNIVPGPAESPPAVQVEPEGPRSAE